MQVDELRKETLENLQQRLLEALREKLNYRFASAQVKQTHLIKQSRRDIARIKMVIGEKQRVHDGK